MIETRIPRRWKIWRHDDGLKLHESYQTIVPYSGNPPKFICEVVEDFKIGESVSKTKRVEIKRWVNYYPDDGASVSFDHYSTREKAEKHSSANGDTIQVELTGYAEVEIPERKVETTREKVESAIGDWLVKNDIGHDRDIHFGDLVDKICGSEAE